MKPISRERNEKKRQAINLSVIFNSVFDFDPQSETRLIVSRNKSISMSMYLTVITARICSVGEGNVFSRVLSVYHSVCPWVGGGSSCDHTWTCSNLFTWGTLP